MPLAIALAAACASGPSAEVAARGLRPSVTTTTEPLAEGIVLIKIFNAAFQPAVIDLDPSRFPVVRWENTDDVEYTIFARGDEFESPVIQPGMTWDFDFSTLEPGVYRYFTVRGAQSIPGLIDTRPAQ
jgi:plastocyanin